MKPTRREAARKLALRRETLRALVELATDELAQVAGGGTSPRMTLTQSGGSRFC